MIMHNLLITPLFAEFWPKKIYTSHKFEFLKSTIFWVVAPYSLVEIYELHESRL
jgi:hypothetical protein